MFLKPGDTRSTNHSLTSPSLPAVHSEFLLTGTVTRQHGFLGRMNDSEICAPGSLGSKSPLSSLISSIVSGRPFQFTLLPLPARTDRSKCLISGYVCTTSLFTRDNRKGFSQ
ncbi:hypothetical protein JZ751_013197 [Albula glossodonta]|uniref:Uncharacterized protein n=1 Tax=Albula glossodonta TaxID=121402 RepID=A0A8T2NWD3_9TELE|nr:hypothetical protein JZ751_013197 [Albula glossodonta]